MNRLSGWAVSRKQDFSSHRTSGRCLRMPRWAIKTALGRKTNNKTMNAIMITMMVVAPVCVVIGWISWVNFQAAFHERDRARMSHNSALEAKNLADKYHSGG